MRRTRSALLLAVATLIVAAPATGDPGVRQGSGRPQDRPALRPGDREGSPGRCPHRRAERSFRTGEGPRRRGCGAGRRGSTCSSSSSPRHGRRSIGSTPRSGDRRRSWRSQAERIAYRSRGSSSGFTTSTSPTIPISSPSCSGRSRSPTCSTTSSCSNTSAGRTGRSSSRLPVPETRCADARARYVVPPARGVASLARAIGERAAEQRGVVERLAANRDALRRAEATSARHSAPSVATVRSCSPEIDDLQQQSSALAAAIRSSQAARPASTTMAPPGSGSAAMAGERPVTSPFGSAVGTDARGNRHRRSLRHPRRGGRKPGRSSMPAGWRDTETSSRSTTAVASRPPTATTRR